MLIEFIARIGRWKAISEALAERIQILGLF